MKTTEVISIDGRQAVKLPDEFRFHDTTVAIRKEGEAVILEPVKCDTWPVDFLKQFASTILASLVRHKAKHRPRRRLMLARSLRHYFSPPKPW